MDQLRLPFSKTPWELVTAWKKEEMEGTNHATHNMVGDIEPTYQQAVVKLPFKHSSAVTPATGKGKLALGFSNINPVKIVSFRNKMDMLPPPPLAQCKPDKTSQDTSVWS